MSNNTFGSNLDNDDASGLPEIKMEPALVRDPPKPKKAAPVARKEAYVRIVLDHNDNISPTGQYFGVNGKGYILKPGIEAEVPVSLVETLNNAIMSTPIVNPQTQQVVGFQDRLRFPYRVIARLPVDPVAA